MIFKGSRAKKGLSGLQRGLNSVLAIASGLLIPCLVLQGTAAACEDNREIWLGDADDIKVAAYYPSEISSTSELVFEGWRADQIEWRINATEECSNGIVICELNIPVKDGAGIEAPAGERVGSGHNRRLVFASLSQLIARAQIVEERKIAAHWFIDARLKRPEIAIPNEFSIVGCQKGDELNAGQN